MSLFGQPGAPRIEADRGAPAAHFPGPDCTPIRLRTSAGTP